MITKDTLLIGDQTTLTFKTLVPKGAKFFFPKPDSSLNGLEIVGIPKIDTLNTTSAGTELQTKIVLTSFDSGSHFWPKLPAYIQKPDGSVDTVWFDGKEIQYSTIQIDTTSFKPYDIKGQMEYPITLKEVLMWAGIAILFALIVFSIVRFIKRRKMKRSFFEKPKQSDPPYLIALRDLEKIRSESLWQNGKEKLYYTYITEVLRVYIEARFNINAMEYTSAEILRDLSGAGIDKNTFALLKDLLGVADLVKFAKYKASADENEGAVPAAIKFVQNTHIEEPVKEKGE